MKLSKLVQLPTISQGLTDDLKIQTKNKRVWLSRFTVEDGMPYDNQVTEEIYNFAKQRWEISKEYEAK